eukprot:TRINITY_DN2366_c0_g2_i8.p1 TRINITY_DN2366_c0_g2~~TRINITY_DN2366_c0_g2_i8.p1  ORF type:complete len:338 (-),score=63.32 TRINITY_DN2366_c0_g2_i8:1844-2857(-)
MSIFAGPYYPAKRESPLASQHAKPERFLSATRLRPRIDPLSQKTPRDAVRPDADLSVAKVLFSPSSDAPAKPRPQSAPARPKGISDALPHDTKCWKRNFVAINRKACAAGSAYSQARKEESLKPSVQAENQRVSSLHKQQNTRGRESPFDVDTSSIGNPKMMGAEEVFRLFDVDESGTLSRKEIHQGLKILGVEASMRKLDDIIKEFDDSGDGLLNLTEFKKCFFQLISTFGKPRPKEPTSKELLGQGKEADGAYAPTEKTGWLAADEEARRAQLRSMQGRQDRPKIGSVKKSAAQVARDEYMKARVDQIKAKEAEEAALNKVEYKPKRRGSLSEHK